MEAIVQQAIQDQVIAAAQQVEDQLDSQLHALDNMDEDNLETLRKRRVDQMKQQARKKQEWLKRGHGEYREIDGEKTFFSEMKGEARMVCHFYRNNWPCKVHRLVSLSGRSKRASLASPDWSAMRRYPSLQLNLADENRCHYAP